jgi:hypothetical protein
MATWQVWCTHSEWLASKNAGLEYVTFQARFANLYLNKKLCMKNLNEQFWEKRHKREESA